MIFFMRFNFLVFLREVFDHQSHLVTSIIDEVGIFSESSVIASSVLIAP